MRLEFTRESIELLEHLLDQSNMPVGVDIVDLGQAITDEKVTVEIEPISTHNKRRVRFTVEVEE